MLITFDTDKDNAADARALVGFLIHVYELDSETIDGLTNSEVPEGTTLAVTAPQPNAPTTAEITASVNTDNVVNFPVPPPPPAAVTAVPASQQVHTPATIAAGATNAVSVPTEYDSAGMPWDARIHQRGKNKKRDGTWKLQKGIDPAIVQAVVSELASRKIATPQSPSGAIVGQIAHRSETLNVRPSPPAAGAVPPPPPPPVTLPPGPLLPSDTAPSSSVGGENSVPLPPVTAVPTPPNVPAQTVAPVVPVPPISPTGSAVPSIVSSGVPPTPVAITYRSIIDKMTAGTKAGTLTAPKVLEIVQACGCPNLQQLNQMPAIFSDVDSQLDLALAGLR